MTEFNLMTPEQVETELERAWQIQQYGENPDDHGDESLWYELYAEYKPYELPGGWSVTLIEDFGGEGQGDQVWKVIRVEHESHYRARVFRKEGYYQSYDGTYYDGEIYEVEPVTETVTVWRKK